jgi:AraC-like DNA-binding protein
MLFRSYRPCSPLRVFVEDFWLYQDYSGEHLHERILPSGTIEMVFNLQEDALRIYGPADVNRCRRFAGAVVSGPYAASFMSDIAEETTIMGVHFKPGGASAVLGLPANELTNSHVELRSIWGPAGATLRDQLCALPRPIERFRLLEHALLRRMSDARRRSRTAVGVGLDMLVRTHGGAKVREIAKTVDLSQRRFIELFAAEVGLTPKLFGRVQRFQYAVASLQGTANVDWAQFAVEFGYFDQSHLIHEFVEFSGLSPSAYLRRQNQLERVGAHVKRHHLPVVS